MSKTTKRTITITGRPPVSIAEANWPVLASAREKDYDNEHEFQANRTEVVAINVRQHTDGRALVYATAKYSTAWQSERDDSQREGVYLDTTETSIEAICSAIGEVCDMMRAPRYLPADVWERLAAECIADLPAEEL